MSNPRPSLQQMLKMFKEKIQSKTLSFDSAMKLYNALAMDIEPTVLSPKTKRIMIQCLRMEIQTVYGK